MPGSGSHARLTRSSRSVAALSMPTFFIPTAAVVSDFSHAEMLGMYVRFPIAVALSSGFDARYFFSTDNFAAALGFVCTHFAPFKIARVPAAARSKCELAHLPFAITAQQNSSL